MVEEPGTAEVREAAAAVEGMLTTRLARVEARSALARMARGGRLTARGLGHTRESLAQLWAGLGVIEVSPDIIERATLLSDEHGLRAYDAVHLASALAVSDAEPPSALCWDRELRAAAEREGLPVGPAF